jgi:HTH-type transcriptional regulator, competence development regulator
MSELSNKPPLGTLFRRKREEKGLLIRQAAAVTELDQAIISRIENCERIPTKEQLLKLAGLYNLDIKETMSAWLAEKMVRDYGDEPYATEAFREAHDKVLYSLNSDFVLLNDSARLSFTPPGEPDVKKDLKSKPGRKPNKPDK